VSYADFITLLFAFFTTLYAISTVDAAKMGKMVTSMRASFDDALFPAGSDKINLVQSGEGSAGKDGRDALKYSNSSTSAASTVEKLKKEFLGSEGFGGGKSLGAIRRNVEAIANSEAFKGRVRTRVDARGLVISLGEGGFFPSGSDQITPEGRKLLDAIATSLAGTSSHVRVEGHTDNVPISTGRFPSNWELSTARATAVVAYLVQRFGFIPESLSAGGYSEFRPVATNETEEGRARNRRIDIVVLNGQAAKLEPR